MVRWTIKRGRPVARKGPGWKATAATRRTGPGVARGTTSGDVHRRQVGGAGDLDRYPEDGIARAAVERLGPPRWKTRRKLAVPDEWAASERSTRVVPRNAFTASVSLRESAMRWRFFRFSVASGQWPVASGQERQERPRLAVVVVAPAPSPGGQLPVTAGKGGQRLGSRTATPGGVQAPALQATTGRRSQLATHNSQGGGRIG